MLLLFISSLVLYGVVPVVSTPIATSNNNERIVGGLDAYAGQFPYQVSIRHSLIGLHLCGGSIISNQWILTSAMCTATYPLWAIRVMIGSIHLNSGGTTYTILYKVEHPDRDEKLFMMNDVGLIRVDGQIIYSDLVKPIKLASTSGSTDLPFVVSGWGLTNIQSPSGSNTLQFVTLKSIPIQVCQNWFPTLTLNDTQICTYSSDGQGICIGDFGNPLVYNEEQYGIASFTGLCGNGFPDVYTQVSSFRNWIKEISDV